MGLNAVVGADFSSFSDAIDKAIVKTEDWTRASKNASRDLSTLVYSLDGTKIQREASLASEAIDRVGGVTKLTAAEAARLSAPINEAIAKYRALGQEVPPHLERTAAALRTASGGSDMFSKSLLGLASAFSLGSIIDRTVMGLVSWTREAFASAGAVLDLSAKTGLGTEALQRMAYAEEQTGVASGALAAAAFKLGANLSGGSGSVQDAVSRVGLSFAALKGLAPEEQFARVASALKSMESPQERNRAGLELFGRSFGEIAPTIAQGYADIADAAQVSTREQLEAIDSLGDAWDGFVRNRMTNFTTILGTWVAGIGQAAKEGARGLADLTSAAMTYGASGLAVAVTSKAAVAATQDLGTEATEAAAAVRTDYVDALASARREMESLTRSQIEQIQAAQALGVSNTELAAQLGISEEALRLLAVSMRDSAKAAAEAGKAAEDMAADHREAADVAAESQQDIWEAAEESASRYGDAFESGATRASDAVGASAEQMRDDLRSVEDAARAAADAMERFNRGGTMEYDLTTNYGRKLIEEMNPGVTKYLEMGYSIEQAMKLLMAERYHYPVDVGAPDGNPWWGRRRAAGGPVSAHEPYLVGEMGPEVFVPGVSGGILPHGAGLGGVSMAAGAVVVNLQYPIMSDPRAQREIAGIVGDAIMSRLRGSGMRLPATA